MAGWKNEGSVHLLSSHGDVCLFGEELLIQPEEKEKIFSSFRPINKFSEGKGGVL